MLSLSMPNASTFSALVESATKCFETCFLSFTCLINHSLADRALVMVSCVVKVFEAIKKRVVSGSSPFRVSRICVPSTFETKCDERPSFA